MRGNLPQGAMSEENRTLRNRSSGA